MRRTGRFSNSLIKFGSIPPTKWYDEIGAGEDFQFYSCEPNNRKTATVLFNDPLGGRNPTFVEPEFTDIPVVIVSSRADLKIDGREHEQIASPVGTITEVTKTGFSVSFRNTGEEGPGIFNWMAINIGQRAGEKDIRIFDPYPVIAPLVNKGIRIGTLSPNYFGPSTWSESKVSLSFPFYKSLDAILVTSCNEFVCCGHHVPSVVGVTQILNSGSFKLRCRNPDLRAGDCNFYYATFGVLEGNVPYDQSDLFIETDDYLSYRDLLSVGSDKDLDLFGPDGKRELIDIAFKTRFPHPPIVLVTPRVSNRDLGESKGDAVLTSAVCTVINVSPFGFRLWINNAACDGGILDFSWIAFSYPGPSGS